MTQEEWETFVDIASLCHKQKLNSINIAGEKRSRAIWAAYMELVELRKQKQNDGTPEV
jgi:hypothetical protein